MNGDVAFVTLTGTGAGLARRLAAHVPGARVHGLAGRVADADVHFTETGAHLRTLFEAGYTIVAVAAAGIVVRALAPVVADKRREPPVLALAEDGSAVVPLLGGHRGANALARRLAELSGGIAALTTAGEISLGFALDAPPEGWTVANPETAKAVTAGLLAGEPVALHRSCAGDAGWLAGRCWTHDAKLRVRITATTEQGNPDTLILHPPVLAVGVGCERGVEPAALHEHVTRALAEAGLAHGAVAAVASIDLKADEPAVHALAEALGVPARFFDAATLEAERPRLANPSKTVFAATGCHGVAEGAALAMAGPGARLAVEKRVGPRVTCAVAEAAGEIDPAMRGRAQGRLTVVGVGPGAAGWRTPAATTALTAADAVVGYSPYLDLIADSVPAAKRHGFPIGAEAERVAHALDLAADGHSVALVGSGDAGIYALGSLVLETLEASPDTRHGRISLAVEPGVSAMQAAAARAGAPLGNDFCAISLSDLMTPRSIILDRLQAAAAADFVVALYNPRSAARTDLLDRAVEIFAAERAANTPVIVGRNLGRREETVQIVPLNALDPATVDMLTLLIIGSSATATVRHGGRTWAFTRRGYPGGKRP